QIEGDYVATEMWHETNAVQDQTIRRETRFVSDPSEWILSGPHITVGTPFFKTPRIVCAQNGDYDLIDLSQLPENYLPRTNYVPNRPSSVYRERTAGVPWDS